MAQESAFDVDVCVVAGSTHLSALCFDPWESCWFACHLFLQLEDRVKFRLPQMTCLHP